MPASPFSRISASLLLGLLIILLCGVLQDVSAASRAPGTLKRIFHPRNVAIQVIPRSIPSHPAHPHKGTKRSTLAPNLLLPSDALRLSLSIPNMDHETEEDEVHLHLAPTAELIHPQAKINYLSATGEVLVSEPLLPHDNGHRLYSGEVISSMHTQQRLQEDLMGGLWYPSFSQPERGVRGWASIHVYDDGLQDGTSPKFAGTVQVDGVTWNIATRENYLRHKGQHDPVYLEESSDLVMFIEGDNHPTSDGDSDGGHTGCSHDTMDWNMDNTTHPVRRPKVSAVSSPWWAVSSADEFPDLLSDSISSRHVRIKRQDTPTGGTNTPNSNYINSIGSTAGCPTEQRVVYVGFAADCNYVSTYGGAEAARTQILTNMNSVSNLYRQTFNVSLGIIELNVVNETCTPNSPLPWNVECSNSITLNDRLSRFSQWRGESGTSDAGLYHLATSCATGSEIGVAWLGTVCQTNSNQQSSGYVSGTGVSVATRSEWSLISHEMGHNFGAIHDCTSGCSLSGACCPLNSGACDAGQRYIMNPSTSSEDPQTNFSPCSIGNICSLMQSNALDYSCMVPPGGRTVLSLQSCGNGILEDGEDCDPGMGSSSACCDSSTCRFINSAVCDPATDACCTSQCSFASNSTVCRPAKDEACDRVEYCTGSARTCPADETVSDGTGCGNGLACASGQCTSNDLQCQTVGASNNLTRACGQRGDRSCVVSCQDPSSSNRCLILQSPLIDGSPCGYGGRCYNATCSSGSVGDQIGSWYTQNKNISIPVTVVGGLIVLAILWALVRCLCCGGCCGGRRRQASPAARPVSSESRAPIRGSQRMSQMSNTGGYGYPSYANGSQGGGPPPGYGDGYGMNDQGQQYAAPNQPPPVHPGRNHYIDDRLYNGPDYRGQ